MLDIPYVGTGVLSSAVGMDKGVMKHLFAIHGLPQEDTWFFMKMKLKLI